MKLKILILALASAALLAAGCGGASDSTSGSSGSSSSGSGGGSSLSLVAYSTPEVVYDEIIPDFQKTPEGRGVSFKTSYGASGDQSRAVLAGQKADVVALSLAPDVDRLVPDKLVPADWVEQTEAAGGKGGFVTTSLVSFVVRKGNPKGIRGWDDLLKPGVKVVTPNPFTSGAAKWNLMGAYQHGGIDYVRRLLTDHVPVQPKSGREALQTFTGGEGDVLISYEYEYTTAVKKGEKGLQLVQPADTFLIQNPIAATTAGGAKGRAFVTFALSDAAQQHFADWGYRPVNQAVFDKNKARFPYPPTVRTIDDYGGWSKVNDELFDPEKGSVAKIEDDNGVSTAK
ncbi:extracellular solute-binding protein [Baekduia soli]|uniref:Extracellular solute-binding protein n=1 Tax=Baekduia soli TaxID=496014 RepID=A0A5B8U2K1_9ACTN|nr:extracellular solute-binding protein [Baekduia soli]QEC47203.1 extracellular solute-binding protein [Baekduia soli]